MNFTKMQGAGNDYIYVNAFREQIEDPSALAVRLSDRHFGIGADGLILICPSQTADVRMEMYNADGSRGKMCGNGIRCVGKYAYDHGLVTKKELSVETDSGIKRLTLLEEDGRITKARVDMGRPILTPGDIPVALSALAETQSLPSAPDRLVDVAVTVQDEIWRITCVSMGNPHCIVQVPDPDTLQIEAIGPVFEHLPLFPERVNTEFIHVDSPRHVTMRVWERGSGETLACGTGACAVAVACILQGLTEREVTVKVRGGDLQIAWEGEGESVWMTGPAETVFEGAV